MNLRPLGYEPLTLSRFRSLADTGGRSRTESVQVTGPPRPPLDASVRDRPGASVDTALTNDHAARPMFAGSPAHISPPGRAARCRHGAGGDRDGLGPQARQPRRCPPLPGRLPRPDRAAPLRRGVPHPPRRAARRDPGEVKVGEGTWLDPRAGRSPSATTSSRCGGPPCTWKCPPMPPTGPT